MIWRLGLERFFRLVKDSCCVVHWTSQAKGKGERRTACRCEKESFNEQSDHAVCLWLLWKWTVCGLSGCIHYDKFCWKTFLKGKQMEWNEDIQICPIETLVCNWTNEYTLDQLVDAGRSVQCGIECVTVGHFDFSKCSLDLFTYTVNFNS
jgi:hypothetical protein